MGASAPVRLHRSIWYMGAKSRVIPGFLDRVFRNELSPGDTVLDLMSGTGVVSSFCAQSYRTISNDVQSYSAAIARSLIEHRPGTTTAFLASLDPVLDLHAAYAENFDHLAEIYRVPLREEEELLAEFEAEGFRVPQDERGEAWLRQYRDFALDLSGLHPYASGESGGRYHRARKSLSERRLERVRKDPSLRPAFLTTAYYANVYYGLKQALQIDSLRAAIDDLPEDAPFAEEKRAHYLSALLHAASVCTSGTSHFAQPRHLEKDREVAAVAKRRCLDIFETLAEYSGEITGTIEGTEFREGNRAFNRDHRSLLGGAKDDFRLEDVDLVYMDPPYTADNYSRFYHVLEVIARYEYPELQCDRSGDVLRGRYPQRTDRFQSGFCKQRGVEDEFRSVLQACSQANAKLVMSYSSPTGLLLKRYEKQGLKPLPAVRKLCKESFRSVRIEKKRFMHSGQGDSNLDIDELLIVCTDPKS